jgi:hypothetical protein
MLHVVYSQVLHGKNLDCFMIEKVEELKNLRQIHAIFMLLREKDKGEKVNRNILFSVIYSLIIYFVFNFPFFSFFCFPFLFEEFYFVFTYSISSIFLRLFFFLSRKKRDQFFFFFLYEHRE